jgi:hypothetical protein
MPFIGKNPTAGFSTIVKDDLTADGSTTAFTLSKQVASANDIAVFVGNVRQEPTDAYSVLGTTLTMTAAPSSGINFYVLHIAGTLESSVVPAAGTTVPGNFGVSGDLTVDTDVLKVDSTNNRVGINQSAPDSALEVRGGSNNQFKVSSTGAEANIKLEGGSYGQVSNATGALYITNEQSSDIYLRTASTTRMTINNSGHITMPNQPAFMAYKNGNQSLTAHTLTKITGWNEAVDQSNEWDNTNGTFTATSAGIYLFGILMQSNVLGGLHLMVRKNGNNGIYGDNYLDGGDLSGSSYTILMPMVANDYVEYFAYLTVNGNINSNRSKVWAVKVG